MFGFLRRWKPTTLFASWVVYWTVLAVVTLTPAAIAIWRATQAPGNKSDVSLNFGSDAGFSLLVHANGQLTYGATASWMTIVLLVGGPPLLLWLAWLSQRPRPERSATEVVQRWQK
jgi:hypothetical protein